MIHQYVQPDNSVGCSLYCISNFLNIPLYKEMEDEPILGNLNQTDESEYLDRYTPDHTGLQFNDLVCHNSALEHVTYPMFVKAIRLIINYPELSDGKTFNACGVTLMKKPNYRTKGKLHRVYMYVFNDQIFYSDPKNKRVLSFNSPMKLKAYLYNKNLYVYRLAVLCSLQEAPFFFKKKDFAHLFKPA